MSYISTLSSYGGGVSKQSRFYDDWSSGNHAVNNTLLYRERIRVENQRLKLTVRDDAANALRQDTERLKAPEASYRSAPLSTQRTTGRSALTTGRRRAQEEEEEAARLAQQMLEAQRQLELEQLIEEERESTRQLEEKFEQITRYLKQQQAKEDAAKMKKFDRPFRFKERKKQPYKVLVQHPIHGRTTLVTARLSGANDPQLTDRGVVRQKNFLKKATK
eukprot:CAMPEP_0195511890 /NCGR_PEP_ID=MMETSP0794_2-20130614/4048_1 /TAXON_ID=515487 /ORGANISM="Stephanopyxis turris, Strain CCMP 815" /LENGTH=218 /DNA_ID=CAMNT_0040639565 /DNA_START=110 /DNA_END=763 /DNA_ORIENTATION=+